MFPKLTRSAPSKLLLIAILLAAATNASANGITDDCKPKIDKNTVVVNLGIPGYNGGRQVALAFPVNSKEAVAGGTPSAHHAAAGATTEPSVRYSVNVVEKRKDGAMLEVVVVTKPAAGPERTLTRNVFVRHNEVVEQMYLGGISLRASFKLLPFSCKK
ncbi:MAG TPA: hypothetical protein VK421_09965 [Pyrinomonadaceae bacterium]|nr:hypothetical protein [Pyrinomonadaceae bacterium]